MPDLFISYKSEERDLVAPIAKCLGALGLDVWFDQKIRAGERWDAAIDVKLKEARVVIVCWSHQSIQSPWVIWEATYAQQAGRLVPVFLDNCSAPGPLSFIQGAKIANWSGQADHEGWRKLLAEIERLLSRSDLLPREEARAKAEALSTGEARRPSGHFVLEKINRKRHRILSIDGAGPRTFLTMEFLKRIEQLLAMRSRDASKFVLSDYFDLIGGTSFGAVIATALALGFKVHDVQAMLLPTLSQWYERNWFSSARLMRELHRVIDDLVQHRTLDSADLRTGLATCTRRLDTGSVWIVTNNPLAPYWESGPTYIGNRRVPIREVLRACIGYPGTWNPQAARVRDDSYGLFVDGAVAGILDPSLHLLMTGTLPAYGLNWETDADKLILISVGSGSWRFRITSESIRFPSLSTIAEIVMRGLRSDMIIQGVMTMQMFGKTNKGWVINSEVGSMENRIAQAPLYSYRRYDVRLESHYLLQELGIELTEGRIAKMRVDDRMSRDVQMQLAEIGQLAADKSVSHEDLPALFDIHLEAV